MPTKTDRPITPALRNPWSFENEAQDGVVVGDKKYGMLVNGIKKSLSR